MLELKQLVSAFKLRDSSLNSNKENNVSSNENTLSEMPHASL
jgi:hypothetical protein